MVRSFVLPGQPTRFPKSHNFTITETKLWIEFDFENKAISGRVTHTIAPISGEITSIVLDSSELAISSIKVDGNANTTFEVFPDSIHIQLGFPLKPGDESKVEVNYSGRPKLGVFFRGPTKEFPDRVVHAFTHGEAENAKNWFPCYDYPNMRTKTEIWVTVPEEMIVVSNGESLDQNLAENKTKKTWHFRLDIPHSSYLVSIVAGCFEQKLESHDEIILQYVYPPGKSEEVNRSFKNTPKMLDIFKELTGEKYPYTKYAQCLVSDFMYGGMENITATTFTERTLHDERSELDYTSDNLVSHELAHQWFGDLITCKDWSHAWLNEGIATYFTALYREAAFGKDDFQYYMYIPVMDFLVQELDRYQRPIVTESYWDPEELFDHHTYEKGAWGLNGLRGMLGDSAFFAGIRKYVNDNKKKNVETFDFRKALEEASGQELESFFQEWFYSPGFPDYYASYKWNADSLMAEVEIEQSNSEEQGVPLFSNPLELRFTFPENKVLTRKVRLAQKKQVFSFSFPNEERPLNVNIDPQNWFLKNLRFTKPKEMHVHQVKNDENSMERVRACMELSNFPTEDVIDLLCIVTDQDPFWGVRVEAGKALGRIGNKSALDALLARLHMKDHLARRGIAFGLRGFANLSDELCEKAINALIFLLENDEAYYVRAYSAWSLGFYKKSQKAFDALARAISQESVNDIIRYRIFQGFWERDDPNAVPIAIDQLLHGKWYQGRSLAAYSLGRIGRGNQEALRALLSAKEVSDDYVREEAASAVGELGNTGAIDDLQKWLAIETEGRVRRRIRESIHLLKRDKQ